MSLTPRGEPEMGEDLGEDMRFLLARSGVMVWSLDIFTYVDDGKRGTSDILVTTGPMDDMVDILTRITLL